MTADMFSYLPGQHTAIVVWPVSVLINLPVSDARVGQLFDVLTEDATLEAALDTLAVHGLTRMPDFAAMAVGEFGVRLTVHGRARVLLGSSGQQVSSSWLLTDTTVPLGAAPVLFMGDEPSGEPNPAPRPILHGIVDVTHLMIGWTPPDAGPDASPVIDRVVRKAVPKPEPQPPVEQVIVPSPSDESSDEPEPVTPEPVVSEPEEPVVEETPEPTEEPIETTGFEHLFGVTTHVSSVRDEIGETIAQPDESAIPPPSLGATQIAPSTMSLDAAQSESDQATNEDEPSADPGPSASSSGEMGAGKPALPDEPGTDIPPLLPPPPPPEGELSGHTVKRSSVMPTGEMIAAVYCPTAHPNPPYAERCRICQAPIPPQQPVEVPRPSLGIIRLANNLVLALDRGAVLGRNPHPVAGSSGPQPNLVRLNDPNKDISSQHLEVRLEGWFVTVRDLNSTNGTQVFLPGQPPVTLRANEPMTLEPGARVVLAQVFDFVFEAQ